MFFRNSLVQPRPVPPRANVLRTLRSDLHSVQTQVICVSKWHIGGCAGGLQRLERPDLGVIRGQHWYPLHTANRLPPHRCVQSIKNRPRRCRLFCFFVRAHVYCVQNASVAPPRSLRDLPLTDPCSCTCLPACPALLWSSKRLGTEHQPM